MEVAKVQPGDLEQAHGGPDMFEGLELDRYQRIWLKAYLETHGILAAQRKSKLPFSYHYRWLKDCAAYSMAWEIVKQHYGNVVEDEVKRRGVNGYKRDLSYQGKLTGDQTTEYSDVLAMAVVKAYRPEYRDGAAAVIGPTQINLTITQDSPQLAAPTPAAKEPNKVSSSPLLTADSKA